MKAESRLIRKHYFLVSTLQRIFRSARLENDSDSPHTPWHRHIHILEGKFHSPFDGDIRLASAVKTLMVRIL